MHAHDSATSRLLIGCDFSSSPNRRKPIVLACGQRQAQRLTLQQLIYLDSLDGFANWLSQSGTWLGAFDFPFGLPRELVRALGWPLDWEACMRHYASLSRPQIRALFAAFCNSRPVGAKFAHRATDGPAGSSPSMKWVNPPVAYMLHAGVPCLLSAGVHLPGLHPGDTNDLDPYGLPRRVAMEGYPGMLAREVLGLRSYKSDTRARQTPERLIARKDLLTALENGQTRLGLRLRLTHAQRDALVDDPRGDALDAVLCLMQAAWAWGQGGPGFGLPRQVDSLEGWIVSAPPSVP